MNIKLINLLWLIVFISACNNLPKENEPARSIDLTNNDGLQLRLTAYESMVRVQYAEKGQEFFPDSHYEMVERHDWDGKLVLVEENEHYHVNQPGNSNLGLTINKETLQIEYALEGETVLNGSTGFSTEGDKIKVSFELDPSEHFTGLGHGYFGRAESIDLQGQLIARNYGSYHGEQAPLIVPFYMSNKGYGIFLNSTFTNFFNFGKDGTYEFGINTSGFDGRMDYFFISGPEFSKILQQYLGLTGKPRLPQRSVFGLQLSDKGHDHNSPTPSDETWWKNKIAAHRTAGYPLDHVVNDNRWRAGGGKRCESFIEWDNGRYPSPADYQKWLTEQGLSMTLDFNRCIAQFSEGWEPSFNIPVTDSIDFKESAPDLTNKAFRDWFWNIFYKKSLDPSLGFPGDGLWIDEFDEMGNAPKDMVLSDGRSSAEMRNYWFFLIAKALIGDGWDQSGIEKRPYVWVRGMTAGGQRYGTLWSGDIKPTYSDMKSQIRGMQLAGLSGFPYWGHDAGGFFDWENNVGPNEDMYQKWSMAYGSFSPIWKPHGMGQSRWPLDRSRQSQESAYKFADLRYKLMPYLYSYAHVAQQGGLPITRAMIFDYPQSEEAWKNDLQYMWGKDLLVAPLTSESSSVKFWLPEGKWFNFWSDESVDGGQVLEMESPEGIHVYAKAGAIIPMVQPELSTSFIDQSALTLHVYVGADGSFSLHEDDGYTEKYRKNNEIRKTDLVFSNNDQTLNINAAIGTYESANTERDYYLIFHGVSDHVSVSLNGARLNKRSNGSTDYYFQEVQNKLVHINLEGKNVDDDISIKLETTNDL